MQALLDAAGPRDRMLLLCAHGGLRINEALALTWDDWEGDSLVAQHEKGGKLRRVAVSGSLEVALSTWREHTDDGTVIGSTQTAAREGLRRLCARATVVQGLTYAVRQYAGTRAAAQSGLEIAAQHLGHASIETTRVYVKWADTSLKDASKGW